MIDAEKKRQEALDKAMREAEVEERQRALGKWDKDGKGGWVFQKVRWPYRGDLI